MEIGNVLPRLGPGILHGILGLADVAQDRSGQLLRGVGVAPHQLGKRVLAPSSRAVHQLIVGQSGQIGAEGLRHNVLPFLGARFRPPRTKAS